MGVKTDPAQLVFCLHGIELALNLRVQLLDDRSAVQRAHAAMRTLIAEAATPLGKKLLSARREKTR